MPSTSASNAWDGPGSVVKGRSVSGLERGSHGVPREVVEGGFDVRDEKRSQVAADAKADEDPLHRLLLAVGR